MAQAGMAAIPGLKETYIQLKTRMDKAVEDFRKAMAATRTGRASVHMLDSVSVDYYGSQMPLNQIAQVHAPEPQMITVQPFDQSQVGAIEKAIRSAELGLNPMNDGEVCRVPGAALVAGGGDREGASSRGAGAQSDERREADPRAGAGADGGAPPGNGEAFAPRAGRASHRG